MYEMIIFMSFYKLHVCMCIKKSEVKKFKSNQFILPKTFQCLPVPLWINPESQTRLRSPCSPFQLPTEQLPSPLCVNVTHCLWTPSPCPAALLLCFSSSHLLFFPAKATSPCLFSWITVTHFCKSQLRHHFLKEFS